MLVSFRLFVKGIFSILFCVSINVDRLLEKENDGKNVIYFWIIISSSFSDNVYTFDYWLIWFETKQEEEENIDSKSET